MDIHRPKPWRGWREFLKEYVIIVVGVLTALAGEQIAETVHRHAELREARENVREELVQTFAQFDKRERVQSCIAGRLDEIDALLRTAGTSGYKAPRWIGRPQLWNTLTDRWEAASQGGRASLFDPDEQSHYSLVYTSLKNAATAETREQQAWAHLRALQDEPAPGPNLIASLKLALQEARFEDWEVRINLGQAHENAAPLHLPSGHSNLIGSTSVCLPMSTTRSEALKQTSPRWGEP